MGKIIMALRNRQSNKSNSEKDDKKSREEAQETKKPFQGRYNPRINRRPERSADGSWLDHQAWTKIVMGFAA